MPPIYHTQFLMIRGYQQNSENWCCLTYISVYGVSGIKNNLCCVWGIIWMSYFLFLFSYITKHLIVYTFRCFTFPLVVTYSSFRFWGFLPPPGFSVWPYNPCGQSSKQTFIVSFFVNMTIVNAVCGLQVQFLPVLYHCCCHNSRTNSMEHSPSWEADSNSSEIPCCLITMFTVAHCWNCVHRSQLLDPLLNQLNTVHSLTFYCF
jgi:hypothetical protein